MATNNTQKLKLLYLMDILRSKTDPDHGLTMPQIIEKLVENGISAERKSLYTDIEVLRDFGLDIRKYQRQPFEYALAERDFELSDLMLLVDAVQSSRFLSDGKSKALVKSIRQMASENERRALNKQVHVHGRPRMQTQSDFNTVDRIQQAMTDRRKVGFQYFRYDITKKKVARREGARHVGTPVSLTYSDGNYYLVMFSDVDREIRNYRVDRMDDVEVLDERADRNDEISAYDPDEVGKCAFGMYGGERATITLHVEQDVMNVIIDRFGRDVNSKPIEGETAARVIAPVMVSPVFFGWLAQMGAGVRIEKPVKVREEYLEFLRGIEKAYEE